MALRLNNSVITSFFAGALRYLPQCLKRIIAEGVSGNVEVLRQHGKTFGLSLFIASTRVSGQNVVVHWKKLVKERKLYEQPLVTWMGIKPEQNQSF